MRVIPLILVMALPLVSLAEAQQLEGTSLERTASEPERSAADHATSWLSAARAAARRERAIDAWALPMFNGSISVISGVMAALPETATRARPVFGAAAALAAGALLPRIWLEHERARPYMLSGLALAGVALGSAIALESVDPRTHWSNGDNPDPAHAFFGASLASMAALMLPFAFLDQGPSPAQLDAALALPPDERAHAALRLLARIDRRRRRAAALGLLAFVTGAAILAAGAASSDDPETRGLLAGLSGVWLFNGVLSAGPTLWRRSLVERYLNGEQPSRAVFGGP